MKALIKTVSYLTIAVIHFVKLRNHFRQNRVDTDKQLKVPDRDTAILLFTRTVTDEFRAKSFGLKYPRFQQLYQSLLGKTKHTLNSVDIPFYEIDSSLQRGFDFGSRLADAIQQVADKGFKKVIVVGNDVPELNPQLLREAASGLQRGANVLGKDQHGGCYLIGIHIDQHNLHALGQIDWHTREVFKQLATLLPNLEKLGNELRDLNQQTDFISLLKAGVLSRALAKLFRALLYSLMYRRFSRLVLQVQQVVCTSKHRGPPLLV